MRFYSAAIPAVVLCAMSPAIVFAAAPKAPAVAPVPAKLRAVLDRYAAWRGGASFRGITSYEADGRIETSGMSGTVLVRIAGVDRYRQDIDVGPVRQLNRISGKDGWSSSLSGQVQRMSDTERDEMLWQGGFLLASALVGNVEHKGVEPIDGAVYDVVRARHGAGGSADFLIASDGRLHAIRSTMGGQKQTTHYSDWRLVDGVRFPFVEEISGDQASDRTVLRFDRMTINRPIESAAFDSPKAESRLSFGPSDSSGWIAYEFFGGNRIFIPATVAGRQTAVLLDSGAEATVVDRSFAANSGLQVEGETTARGVGGASTAGMIANVAIDLGSLKMHGLTVASIDLSTVEKHLGHPLPVVLGAEIFRDAVVEIDFAGRRIAFHDPARFQVPDDAVALPVSSAGGMYTIPATIEGRAATLDMDLGSGSPLFLYPRFWSHDFAPAARASTTLMGGVGGMKEAGVATVGSVKLGNATFANVPVELHGTDDEVSATGRSDGNIGLPMLSRFHLIVDLPHGKLWLKGKGDTATPFEKNRAGVAMLPEEKGVRVLHVAKGSPAAKIGLKEGDVIATVNGEPANRPGRTDWRYGVAGTSVRLGFVGGRTVDLVLRDYF